MLVHVSRIASAVVLFGMCVFLVEATSSQEGPPPAVGQNEPAPIAIPKGIEVLARGPVHEAFAAPLTEPKATPLIAKKPPVPVEEMPPEERPEGDCVWIGGYWSWDDDRADYLWVSGCWRVKPAGKEWVPGYWREQGVNWQWAPGFWTNAQAVNAQNPQNAPGVTYYPQPPAPPNVAPAGDPPIADSFYIPGYWMWTGDRYAWRAGYWTRVRPGFVYVPSHYRWTPFGHVFVAGYWDYAVARRGVLYAPITVDVALVGPRYVYTPYYAVRDTIVLDTLFVRPAFGAYYFGDYYGPRYVAIGFMPGVVYSRRHYEPIITYQTWVYRDNPRWHQTQINLVVARNEGRAPVPPRTLVQQTTIINNNVTKVTNVTNVIAPTRTVVAAAGSKTVRVDNATRVKVAQQTLANHQTLAADRRKLEATRAAGTPLTKPHTAALSVPTAHPVSGKTTTIVHPPLGKGTSSFDPKGSPTKTPGVGAPRDGGRPIIRPPMKKPMEERKKGRR